MKKIFLTFLLLISFPLFADNQTATLSPILPPDELPFTISIDLMELQLPTGWHSGAVGFWKGKTVLIAGRINGMHGFSNIPNVNNFPPTQQNTTVFVVDIENNRVWQRSLTDPSSGLTQAQIDTLSVTSPQFYQSGKTLYISGGYGIDSATGEMTTKSTLSAIDVPGLIRWVTKSEKKGSVLKNLRQTSDPLVQVTGGYMNQASSQCPTLLIFGQNFTGLYRENSNGTYTQQVQKFCIRDSGNRLAVIPSKKQPQEKPEYRRRDLNVVPVIRPGKCHLHPAYVAFSGVFTETTGIWTVPVIIFPDGRSFMPDPEDPATFKQGMNNYVSAFVGLYSRRSEDMYVILFGGITFGFFQNGVFETDPEFPFTNQVTTIKMDRKNVFTQYLMDAEYPTILSTFSNPGNTLLFGAGACFIKNHLIAQYPNKVLALDPLLRKSEVLGYIIGGIQSTVPNTSDISDSAASPYIFQVTLQPK